MRVMNALDRFVEWFRTYTFTDRNNRLPEGLRLQYHSRSDAHSQKLGELIVADLVDGCPSIRTQAARGEIAYGINHVFVWPNGKAKTLDLAIGIPLIARDPPIGAPIHRLETQTLSRKTPGQSLGRLLIACEEKTVMTEHGKSQPRVYSELNDSHTIVHQGSRDTIAAGITAVNIAASFVSPLRQLREKRVEYSLHDQPHVTANMVAHLRKLPTRHAMDDVGFDAYCTFVVDLDNQGHVALHTALPSPQPGDFDHYATFLQRICHFYAERYHNLQALPEAAGLSIEETLTNLAREHRGLMTTTGELAVREGLEGSEKLQVILESVERQANPPE
jgi:hypothetical protein